MLPLYFSQSECVKKFELIHVFVASAFSDVTHTESVRGVKCDHVLLPLYTTENPK